MQEQQPGTAYAGEIGKQEARLEKLLKKRSALGWTRLVVFVITVLLSYQVFTTAGLAGIAVVIVGMALLLYLVSVDVSNNQEIRNTKTLITINGLELKSLDHDFGDRYDGREFSPDVHDYANDLDLFGKASLFQWLNRCYTEQGRRKLANNLLQAMPLQQIKARHEAVREISNDLEWRQQFQSFAMQTAVTSETQRKAETWLQEKEVHFAHPFWKIFVLVYSLLTLGSAVLAITGYLPAGVFPFLFVIYLIVSMILSRNTVKPYVQLSGIVKEISALYQLVGWIEAKKFSSGLLSGLQKSVKTDGQKAAEQIRALRIILDRFDLRLSIIGLLFFNSFLLWDVRQMIALNTWRRKNKRLLPEWFSMVAEVEVLNSLSTMHFNHPGWCFPTFSEQHFSFRAKELGHPLIHGDSLVNNDFELEGTGKTALVTGSNMAGKSTFLRSLGVNTVLAQMGAPVCAKSLSLSPVQLMSSMRVADNLAENTSTFYAELKKLKTIIEAAGSGAPVFILLDEILRGTNSLDRHKGSEALIAQLIRLKAVAVIATHDLELARLEKQFPASVENYHFDVQVEGEELYFDYRLKHGVCTSLNASILMKKIGIELN